MQSLQPFSVPFYCKTVCGKESGPGSVLKEPPAQEYLYPVSAGLEFLWGSCLKGPGHTVSGGVINPKTERQSGTGFLVERVAFQRCL